MRTWSTVLFFGDLVLFLCSLIIMIGVSFGIDVIMSEFLRHISPFIIVFLLWSVLIYIFNGYDRQVSRPSLQTFPVLAGLLGSWFVVAVLLFYFAPFFVISPKENLVLVLVIYFALYIVWRRIAHRLVVSGGYQPLVLVGQHTRLNQLRDLAQHGSLPFVLHSAAISVDELMLDTIPRNATVVLAPGVETAPFAPLIAGGVAVYFLGEFYEQVFEYVPLDTLPDDIGVHLSQYQGHGVIESRVVRIIELVFAYTVIVITLPITSIVAVLIWVTDRGPVFYHQARVGQYGAVFQQWKFRSMRTDAESFGAVWASEQDPRVTWIGRIIRTLHIDEIPQMWNIIQGDIALVGPRPERPEFVSQLTQQIPGYQFRHIVQPGFTGWAQVKFRYARSVEDSARKLEYDLYYIKHRSILLDIGCILKTVQIIFTH